MFYMVNYYKKYMKIKDCFILNTQINCKNKEKIPKKIIFKKWLRKTLYKKKILKLLQLEL